MTLGGSWSLGFLCQCCCCRICCWMLPLSGWPRLVSAQACWSSSPLCLPTVGLENVPEIFKITFLDALLLPILSMRYELTVLASVRTWVSLGTVATEKLRLHPHFAMLPPKSSRFTYPVPPNLLLLMLIFRLCVCTSCTVKVWPAILSCTVQYSALF